MESLSFIGDTVEIECGVKGVYKGTVSEIDTKLQEIGIRDGKSGNPTRLCCCWWVGGLVRPK